MQQWQNSLKEQNDRSRVDLETRVEVFYSQILHHAMLAGKSGIRNHHLVAGQPDLGGLKNIHQWL
jgi:hypothetical protein